jgi:toxin FitB
VAQEYLAARFTPPHIGLPAELSHALLERFARAGLAGGAVYDGLVGAATQHAGATLLSLDVRAASTYRMLGVDFTLLA